MITTSIDEEVAASLHRELIEEFSGETEAWVAERLTRVMARLNAVRPDGAALEAHVLWIREFTAFTTPGPHVYVGRRLLERLPSDEATAFVLAHEAAHHDLGHLDLFRGWLEALPRGTAGSLAAALFRHFEHRLYGPEREAEADLYAVQLCLDAGYNGALCLQALEIMENVSLDRGDVDGVFGPENLLDPTDPGRGSVAYGLQRWLWSRAHRYLPLRERRERAWTYLRRRERERAGLG